MMGENGNLSLKGLIQGLTNDGVTVVQGIVKAVNPLRIQIVNDEKLVIGSDVTYVPKHLTERTTAIDIMQEEGALDSQTALDGSHSHAYSGTTDIGGSPPHAHSYRGKTEDTAHRHALQTFNIYKAKIKLYDALQVGEKVHLLAFNHGKQYYVLDRVAL